MKRAIIGAATAATIAVAGMTGATAVHAEQNTNSSTTTNPTSSLIDKLVSTFHLDKSQVEKVFDENRTAMQQEHEAKLKEHVAQLVKDGKLTQDQADKINAKRAELEKQREAVRPQPGQANQKSREDMKKLHDQEKADIDKWMTDNKIPAEYAHLLGFGHGHGHGPEGMDKAGPHGDGANSTQNAPADTPATN